ncbi:hypothetical protein B566_EDAN007710, partial [Ephemera danica]
MSLYYKNERADRVFVFPKNIFLFLLLTRITMGVGKSRVQAQNAEKARKMRETALNMVDIQAEEQVEAYLVKSSLQSCESLNEDGKLVSRYRRIPERPAGQYFSLSNAGTAKSAAYRTTGVPSMAKQMPTLANLTISPDDLRLVALRTAHNSHKNCQTWAVDAAWSLVYLQQQRRTCDAPPTYQEAISTQETKSGEASTVEDPVIWHFSHFCLRMMH